jgi:two-component system response regulator DegU
MASTNGTTRRARILIVQARPLFKEYLLQLINDEDCLVCFSRLGHEEKIKSDISQINPDLAILELGDLIKSRLELIESLKLSFPELRIQVVCSADIPAYMEKVLRVGVVGYATDDLPAQEALNGIRAILKGELYIAPKIRSLLLRTFVERGSLQSNMNGLSVLKREFYSR